MSECKDNEFDLAVVDPPYFNGPNKLGYYGARVSSTGIYRPGYEKTDDWEVPEQPYFDELQRVSKNQIIWGINNYKIQNIGAGRIVWDKVKNPNNTFSDCEIAYSSFHDSIRMFVYLWDGMLQAKSIHEPRTQRGNKKKNEKRIHPTQKPVALYDWILQKYSKPGQKILDTHLGSGSICHAAHKAGIDLIGCEKTKKYVDDAREWFDKFSAQMRF